MNVGWPQITFIVLYVVGFLITLAKHGEPRTGTHDIGITTASTLIGITILYFGGFWT